MRKEYLCDDRRGSKLLLFGFTWLLAIFRRKLRVAILLLVVGVTRELGKDRGYEGFAVSVTDEQGNEVAYVTIGEAAN